MEEQRLSLNPPSRQVLDNPDQHLRYMRQVAEVVQQIASTVPQLAAGIASVPSPRDPGEWLAQNGQAALASLNIDLASTARTNVASGAPGTGDDSTQGYNYFSRWIDTSGPTLYTCIDPSPGAAVWV